MATYETGTATGTSDLISKLATFATSQGWTVSSATTSNTNYPGSGISGRVFSKGSLVFGVGYPTDDIYIVGATAVSGGVWNAQTGSSSTSSTGYGARTSAMTGPYQAYHFFAGTSPDYLHVVVETSAGIYRHFHMGSLIKAGTYTGGAYCAGTYWYLGTASSSYYMNVPTSSYHQLPFDASGQAFAQTKTIVRADIDGKTNNWMWPEASTGNRMRGCTRWTNASSYPGLLQVLHTRSPSEFNQLTPLLPIPVAIERPSSLFSHAGYVPDLRYPNMTNFSAGEVITLGSDQWMVFPAIQKTATWGAVGASGTANAQVQSSGTYGFAYKRN